MSDKNKEELSEEVVKVKSKSGEEFSLNWRGKLIPAEKALSDKEKKERNQVFLVIIKFAVAAILVMTVLWLFLGLIPSLV